MKNLFISSGSKGGVGKSMVSIALIDYLLHAQEKHVHLIESDTSNPDVAKTFANDENVKVVTLRLDDADGWIQLVNFCDSFDGDVVVNSAARSNEAVAKYGATLTGSLEELDRAITTFWTINRQRDSLELLKKYAAHMTGVIHVVRNLYFGAPEKFELFNASAIAADMKENGKGKVADFPDLADRVADDLYSQRLSITSALDTLPLGNKAELKRWRKLAWDMFAGMLDV